MEQFLNAFLCNSVTALGVTYFLVLLRSLWASFPGRAGSSASLCVKPCNLFHPETGCLSHYRSVHWLLCFTKRSCWVLTGKCEQCKNVVTKSRNLKGKFIYLIKRTEETEGQKVKYAYVCRLCRRICVHIRRMLVAQDKST